VNEEITTSLPAEVYIKVAIYLLLNVQTVDFIFSHMYTLL